MKSEFVPKGYNTWHEYYQAKERRERLMERASAVLVVVVFLTALIVVSRVEGM